MLISLKGNNNLSLIKKKKSQLHFRTRQFDVYIDISIFVEANQITLFYE